MTEIAVLRGSEFTVVTNCFTAERDLPPNLYWSGITPHQATEERPLPGIKAHIEAEIRENPRLSGPFASESGHVQAPTASFGWAKEVVPHELRLAAREVGDLLCGGRLRAHRVAAAAGGDGLKLQPAALDPVHDAEPGVAAGTSTMSTNSLPLFQNLVESQLQITYRTQQLLKTMSLMKHESHPRTSATGPQGESRSHDMMYIVLVRFSDLGVVVLRGASLHPACCHGLVGPLLPGLALEDLSASHLGGASSLYSYSEHQL